MSAAIEHESSRPGRWLQAKRTRFALWIAAAEALIVAISRDTTKWTVLVLAIVAVIAWAAGRDSGPRVVRQVLWIFAASQLLALLAVVLAVMVKWAAIIAVVAFAIGGLVYLFLDRR